MVLDTLRKFNDTLALIIILLTPTLWIVNGTGYIVLGGEVVGATIAGWMLVLQFYFRKAPPKEE